MARPKKSSATVSREAIIQAALDLLESDGYEKLTLSRIAAQLDVQTPALYWYFKNRADLNAAVSEAIFRDALATIPADLSGRALLAAFGLALRNTLLSRRDCAKLVSLAPAADAAGTEIIPALIARIASGGISATQAMKAQIAMQSLALGWATFESNPSVAVAIARGAADVEAAFAEAVRTLADNYPAN